MKNTIVVYRGGGYDGCFWELNAFCYDKSGKWINIYSSGYAGIKSESVAAEYMQDVHTGIISIVDCNDAEKVTEANKNNIHPQFQHSMLLYIEKELIDIDYFMTCCKCGANIDHESGVCIDPNDSHGDGGIGVVYEGYYCNDCYSEGMCIECDGYYGNDLDSDGLCEYCKADKLKHTVESIDKVIIFNTVMNELSAIDTSEYDIDDFDDTKKWYIIEDKLSGIVYLNDSESELCAIDDLFTVLGHKTMVTVTEFKDWN